MKKIVKLLFSISMFFILTIGIKAENAYTWACEYQYNNAGVDVRIQYRMTSVPESVLKSSNALASSGSKYTTVWYYSKKQGKFVQTSGQFNDYEGHGAGDGYVHPNGESLGYNTVKNEMLRKSVSSSNIVCPALYFTDHCLGNTKGGLYATYSPDYVDSTAGISCRNYTVSSKGAACYTAQGSKVECSEVVNKEELFGNKEGHIECEYKTESSIKGKQSFRLIYDTSTGLQYDNAGGTVQVEWQDKERLEESFKKLVSKQTCPTSVSCSVTGLFNWGGKIKVGSTGGSFKGNAKCGANINNNGQDVTPGDTSVMLNDAGIGISEEKMSCEEVLGKNLQKVLHLFITAIRIAGAIIAILNGMLSLIPAITSDNSDALKKAIKKCVMMLIILAVIGIFPTIIRVIGLIAGFDLSCL